MNWLTKILDEMAADSPSGRVSMLVGAALVVALLVAVAWAVLAVGAPAAVTP